MEVSSELHLPAA